MKNFSIHCLTLTLMFVMVYATPHKKGNLQLQLIHKEAEQKLHERHKNSMVLKVSGNLTVCVTQFFCLAEKSLSELSANYTRLVELLDEYNKGQNDTSCTLKTKAHYHVNVLLKDIIKCSKS